MKNGLFLRNPFLYVVIMLCIIGGFASDVWKTGQKLSNSQNTLQDSWTYHFAVDVGELESWFAREFLRGAEVEAKEHGIVLEINGKNSSYESAGMDFISWSCIANIDAVISIGKQMDSGTEDRVRQSLESQNTECAVVLHDIDCGNELYIGPDNYQEGFTVGQKLAEAWNGEAANVALIYSTVEKSLVKSRLDGFYAALDGAENIRILREQEVSANVLEAMGSAEELLISQKEIQEIVCFDEIILDGVVRGIIDLNYTRTVHASGIGYSEEIEEYMEKGIVNFVVDVNAYEMGREAVKQLYLKKKRSISGTEKYYTGLLFRRKGQEEEL